MINNFIQYLKSMTGGAGELIEYETKLKELVNKFDDNIIKKKIYGLYNLDELKQSASDAVNKYNNNMLPEKEANIAVNLYKNRKEEAKNKIYEIENLKKSKEETNLEDWEDLAEILAKEKKHKLRVKFRVDTGKSNEEIILDKVINNKNKNPYFKNYKNIKKRSGNEFDAIDFTAENPKTGQKYDIELKSRPTIPNFQKYPDYWFGVNKMEEVLKNYDAGDKTIYKFWVYIPNQKSIYEATFNENMKKDFLDQYQVFKEYEEVKKTYEDNIEVIKKLENKLDKLKSKNQTDEIEGKIKHIETEIKELDNMNDNLDDRQAYLMKQNSDLKDFGVFWNNFQKAGKGDNTQKKYYNMPRWFFKRIDGEGDENIDIIDLEKFQRTKTNTKKNYKYLGDIQIRPSFDDYLKKFNNTYYSDVDRKKDILGYKKERLDKLAQPTPKEKIKKQSNKLKDSQITKLKEQDIFKKSGLTKEQEKYLNKKLSENPNYIYKPRNTKSKNITI